MPTTIDRLKNPRFRFRQKEIALIKSSWRDGQSVLLTGIRRTGKSEIAKAALVVHGEAGGEIGFLNVQNLTTLHDFYREILEQMPTDLLAEVGDRLKALRTVPDKLLNWIRSHVTKVEVLEHAVEFQAPEGLQRYWQPIVEALELVLAKHPSDKLPVLGIDELPFMLENLIREGVSDNELIIAMASLRKLRDAGLRMIIAGSISMENLLTLHHIPHTVLGGLFRVPVPPFTREEARLFLKERLNGTVSDSDEIIELALDTLPDFVPEFLRITEQYLRIAGDMDQCAKALQEDILPSIRRAFLTQFDERLTKNYPAGNLAIAEEILDRIARASAAGTRLEGKSLPTGYRSVVQMLQYDNFIFEGTDYHWQFSLGLLRQWWRAERGIA